MSDENQGLAARLAPLLQSYLIPQSQLETWTPTYSGTATAGITTYTTQTGWYVRLGPLVVAYGELTWTAATGTGNIRVGGLPVTPTDKGMVLIYPFAVTFAGSSLIGTIASGSTTFDPVSPASGGGAFVPIDTAGSLFFLTIYPAEG